MENLVVIPKNDLAQEIKTAEIKNKICDRLNKIENLQDYKLNNEFLVLATNLIEYYVKKKHNIDKSNLLITIYEKIFFNFTDEEKSTVRQNIQFIWNNGHIKKIAYYKLMFCGIKEWLKKKVC
jgi:hypothetical protein